MRLLLLMHRELRMRHTAAAAVRRVRRCCRCCRVVVHRRRLMCVLCGLCGVMRVLRDHSIEGAAQRLNAALQTAVGAQT